MVSSYPTHSINACVHYTLNVYTVINLCIIVEVSKLCLPDDQRIWVAHGEAQLKAEHCKFTQGTVADSVLGLGLRDV